MGIKWISPDSSFRKKITGYAGDAAVVVRLYCGTTLIGRACDFDWDREGETGIEKFLTSIDVVSVVDEYMEKNHGTD